MVHSMIWLKLDWTFEMSKCSSAIWIKLDGNFLLYTRTCKKKAADKWLPNKDRIDFKFIFRLSSLSKCSWQKKKQQSDLIFRVRACCICLTTKFETILWSFLKEIFHATFLSAVELKMSLIARQCMYVLFLLLRHFVRHSFNFYIT